MLEGIGGNSIASVGMSHSTWKPNRRPTSNRCSCCRVTLYPLLVKPVLTGRLKQTSEARRNPAGRSPERGTLLCALIDFTIPLLSLPTGVPAEWGRGGERAFVWVSVMNGVKKVCELWGEGRRDGGGGGGGVTLKVVASILILSGNTLSTQKHTSPRSSAVGVGKKSGSTWRRSLTSSR